MARGAAPSARWWHRKPIKNNRPPGLRDSGGFFNERIEEIKSMYVRSQHTFKRKTIMLMLIDFYISNLVFGGFLLFDHHITFIFFKADRQELNKLTDTIYVNKERGKI